MKLSVAILLSTVSLASAEDAALRDIISIGTRPYYLVEEMKDGELKNALMECAKTTTSFKRSDFSIGHRGACMQYPEHTVESYKAAALMGAGIIECDVTFTKDRELVCRHAQCDLHTTTDVVTRPELNAKCTTPFETGVEPKCCSSDFTLEEIQSLCGKMDSKNSVDGTAEEYAFGGTADWRTDLYSHGSTCPKIPTHAESIELIKSFGAKFTPELKSPDVEMPYEGDYTQEMYAQQMADDYVKAGIDPSHVWLQSFNSDDVIYWVNNTDFGDQAVALDGEYEMPEEEFKAWHKMLADAGVKIVAPPMWRLVDHDPNSDHGMVPSAYVASTKENGLDIITWTLERTGPGLDGWYWQTTADMEKTEGDRLTLLHVLNEDVGVLGVFSDWPATTTFYANCMKVAMHDDHHAHTEADVEEEEATDGSDASASGSRYLMAAGRLVNLGLRMVGI